MKWERADWKRLGAVTVFRMHRHQAAILSELSGDKCWSLGNQRIAGFRPDWEAVKVDVMCVRFGGYVDAMSVCLSLSLSLSLSLCVCVCVCVCGQASGLVDG